MTANPHRGERTLRFGDSDQIVLFTIETVVLAEQSADRGALELLNRLGYGSATTLEVAASLKAGLEGWRRRHDPDRAAWTDPEVFELLAVSGVAPLLPGLYEALAEVVLGLNLAHDDEDPDGGDADPPKAGGSTTPASKKPRSKRASPRTSSGS